MQQCICADTRPSATTLAQQTVLLQKATFNFAEEAHKYKRACDNLRDHLLDRCERNEVCAYTGVQCEDGVVLSLFLWNYKLSKWAVRLEWMVPAMQHIHLNGIRLVNGIKSQMLPWALRSMYLKDCFWHKVWHRTKFLNFRKFPAHLEEFTLDGCSFARGVALDNLPRTMRFMVLRVMQFTGRIHVDKDGLPPGITQLIVQHTVYRDGNKMEVIGESE